MYGIILIFIAGLLVGASLAGVDYVAAAIVWTILIALAAPLVAPKPAAAAYSWFFLKVAGGIEILSDRGHRFSAAMDEEYKEH